MNKLKLSFLSLFFLLLGVSLNAKENIGGGKTNQTTNHQSSGKVASDCLPATAQTELNVNNVRTTLLAGGDLWWDLDNGRYEVPKVERGSGETSRHSLFAGALWMGGIDALGQLKVAAQTYRQTGNDFFPGPLDDKGQINRQVCASFDRFWEVSGSDISTFISTFEENEGQISVSQIPESLLKWPAKNNTYFGQFHTFDLPPDKDLAPYYDVLGDEIYDPLTGDYPVINPEISGVYADQMIWWIFNDKGNVHSETGGEALGVEVGALAFAFSTNDEVNNMTFYKYSIDNKSTTPVDSVFFGQWVDPDLGNYTDDFVGCDTINGLGIVYNGDAVDDGANGYGDTPPMLAVDYFQGPKDENGNELGMSSFVYYDNDFTVRGNPETAAHVYGYLAGVWKDRTPFTFGGTGKDGSEPTNYMFPSDPNITDGEGVWSECSAGNEPADRRFLQVSGPFLLEPGAQNEIIVGVVWVRDGITYPCPSFDVIRNADRKAQALFDSGFKVLDGPDAPNVTIRELDKELILSIWNPASSNNHQELYEEVDAILASQDGVGDSTYNFQGYRIYQLESPVVTAAEYNSNPDVAREIFTVDIKDGVTRIINTSFNPDFQANEFSIEVEGTDNGIRHVFRITEDQFADEAKDLINHKPYYFSVVAYGYNPESPTKYLAGRQNIRIYTGIPHITDPEFGGTALNSSYGDGPEVTTITGSGNGGLNLELTDASIDAILQNGSIANPVYKGGNGPIDVRVYDPVLVPEADFRLTVQNSAFASIEICENPAYGTVTSTCEGTITYTPNIDKITVDDAKGDQICYEISNQFGALELGYITVGFDFGPIAIEPIAFSDSEVIKLTHTNYDGTPAAAANIDVLANDYPFGGDLTIVSVSNGVRGETNITATNQIRYIRTDYGFVGRDQFEYVIQNNQTGLRTTGIAVVNMVDTRVPTDPLNSSDDIYFIDGADDFVALDVSAGANSADIEPLTNDVNALFGSDVISPYSTWKLENLTTGFEYDYNIPISLINEQGIGGWEYDPSQPDFELNWDPQGFIVGLKQVPNPSEGDATISSSVNFADPRDNWLSAIPNQDGAGFNGTYNWIRSGSFTSNDAAGNLDPTFSDYLHDANQFYEQIGSGSIAPYCLAANIRPTDIINYNEDQGSGAVLFYNAISPACSDCYGFQNGPAGSGTVPNAPTNTLDKVHSVDLVITSDQTKWTRCAVVEMGRFSANNVGGADKNSLRQSTSLDINGNEIAGDVGRSWFPGYAIDLQTGTRLNIMFSENSFMPGENGNDMVWNPTATIETQTGGPSAGDYRMGGEQFIYIMGSQYDEGVRYQQLLGSGSIDDKKSAYDEAMWVTTSILTGESEMRSMADGLVPSDINVKLRMGAAYTEPVSCEPLVYEFSTRELAAETGNTDIASSALDLVKVVPNPYYAYSVYENNKFDNRVKITNLPPRATVKIFTLSGDLVRELSVDNTNLVNGTSLSTKDQTTVQNAIDWDLRNFRGIPVAGGMYIIHIEAPDLGEERVIKWFGVMRQLDLETF